MTTQARIDKYSAIRQAAYDQTQQKMPIAGLRLTEITASALDAWSSWPGGREPPNGGWDWRDVARHYRERHHDRFEIAIWHEDMLCGLGIGKPSNKKILLRIQLIEGAPAAHPLVGQIAPIIIACAELYATAIGAEEVHLMEPVDDLIEYYEELGYDYRRGTKNDPSSCYKQLP